jgi:hypothetical protein
VRQASWQILLRATPLTIGFLAACEMRCAIIAPGRKAFHFLAAKMLTILAAEFLGPAAGLLRPQQTKR